MRVVHVLGIGEGDERPLNSHICSHDLEKMVLSSTHKDRPVLSLCFLDAAIFHQSQTTHISGEGIPELGLSSLDWKGATASNFNCCETEPSIDQSCHKMSLYSFDHSLLQDMDALLLFNR